ncbi:hypothetical protein FHS18_000320 [Paenibacillus phyllosphaerae]|uniref:CYTH domain-containing protein n=1 Tax=Paenibacillus phyllosphaerae TaxID=274593 RepID=A0A7W5ATB7_9BACL|nr:hypothetical protein [Paenibacillus phyllosphaerae]MBB3108292.1 hypothetical protein [Paenibacillus phyllosphaerae]
MMNLGWKSKAVMLLTGLALVLPTLPQSQPANAASANMVPGYEVKFLLKSGSVLGSDYKPTSALKSAFGLGSATSLGVEYFDTDALELDEQGWDVRFRKKSNKSNFEINYKKRYPIVNGDINAALALANQDGFDAGSDDFEAEVDWGYGKQTLSIATEETKSASGYSGTSLPTESKALEIALDKMPGELADWGSNGWGEDTLEASRAHGPVTVSKYEGEFNDLETDLEIWPILNAAGTGTEYIVEVSFKTDSYSEASTERVALLSYLQGKGWLQTEDSLKTQLILERY